MALCSRDRGTETNSWWNSDKAMVLRIIGDNMAGKKPLSPSQYVFYPWYLFLYISIIYEIRTVALDSELIDIKKNFCIDAKIL